MPSHPTSGSANACFYQAVQPAACDGLPHYAESQGIRYCVLHYPSSNKAEAFLDAYRSKVDADDYNFRDVWFPSGIIFLKETFASSLDFSNATFNGSVYFQDARFDDKVRFSNVTFNGDVSFLRAKFSSSADFSGATFDGKADFVNAQFTLAFFNLA